MDAKDYDEIHFFGDKTNKVRASFFRDLDCLVSTKLLIFVLHIFQGGNDYEIYTSERTIGHSVKNPDETIQILDELFP